MADTPLVKQLQDSSGSVVDVDPSNESQLRKIGYTDLSPEQLQEQANQEKFGTTGQQLITGLEGAGSAATFGLSTGLEKSLGVNPQDIAQRQRINPGSHMLGQIAGIAGTGGAFGALDAAGLGAGELLGLGAEGEIASAGERAAASALENGATKEVANVASQAARASTAAQFSNTAKIGSKAVKLATENALFSAGDEVSKMLSDQADPTHPVQTAITNIGLSGLIGGALGGALGTVNPLWKATMSGKTGSILDAIGKRAGGEGIPEELNNALQTTGIDIPPEVKAALGNDPAVRQMFQTLQDSSTGSGLKAQEALKTFKGNIGDYVAQSLGKSPEELEGLRELSPNQAGRDLQNTLADEYKAKVGPLAETFQNTTEKYKSVPLSDVTKNEIAESFSKLAQDKGYNLSTDSDQLKYIQRVYKDLPNLKTLEDLRKYQSVLGEDLANKQMWDLGKSFRGIFNQAEGDLVQNTIGKESPDLLANHIAAKAEYARISNLQDSLNDRLHVGKYGGPSTFIRGLKGLEPEAFLRRLDPKDDADLLATLQSEFPETAAKLKDYQLSNLLKSGAEKAPEGANLNYNTVFKHLDAIKSPEYRKYLIDDATQGKLDAIKSLVNAIPEKIGKSGTPQGLDALWSKIPGSAIGIAAMLAGHNPAMGFVLGALTKVLSRDAPDAVRLGLLKFLGSSAPLEAEGFKSMVDFISHTIKGENLISKAVTGVFKAGADVIPSHLIPSDKQRDKLDTKLKDLQANQSPLFDVGGKIGHYMPPQGMAMGQTAAQAVNYLNSLRPNTDKKNPLDSKVVPSKVETAEFNNALDIAEQPLLVMKNIKEGTVTPTELVHLKNLYPGLYDKLSNNLQHQMIKTVSDETVIPYKTRIGLSMFLAQPMDSTMTPSGIMAAQPKAPQAQPQGPHSMKNITKLAASYQTPQQAREASKLKA